MKRIILITNAFPFGKGEASFIYPELQQLRKHYPITIISRNSQDKQTTSLDSSIEVYRYNSTIKNKLFIAMKTVGKRDLYKQLIKTIIDRKSIKKTIKFMARSIHFSEFLKRIRLNYTENVIFYTYWNDYATYSATQVKKKEDEVFSRIHGGDLYLRPTNSYDLPYKEIMNQRIDKLFFISKNGLNYYLKTFPEINPKKLEIYYMGTPPILQEKKMYTNAKSDSLKILSFSNITFGKRIELIIDTLNRIEDIFIEWVHIGSGELESEIEKIAHEKLSAKRNVKYSFWGQLENSNALTRIRDSEFDFLLNVSYSEGLPVTMMEAMSLGIPVIATDVGGVAEIVSNNNNGFLIPRDFDIDELVQVIKKFSLLEIDEKNRMKKNAYETWKTKFNSDVNYKRFVKQGFLNG